MSQDIRIKRGVDIKLVGKAEKMFANVTQAKMFALQPDDFHGITPKLTVKAGEQVKAGDTLFYSKYNDKIKFTSPVSGEVVEIVRGAKRKILEVKVLIDSEITYKEFSTSSSSREEVIETLLESGAWAFIKQRPYDVIANPSDKPKAIFISGFNSAPLAADYDFTLQGKEKSLQKGIDIMSILTNGKVHLSLDGSKPASIFQNISGVDVHNVTGPHPAGNVGVQIHHIDPVNKGERVWTVTPHDLVIIGDLFLTGNFNAERVVALTGSGVNKPRYVKTIAGTSLENILKDSLKSTDARIISGGPLTGTKVSKNGYLGYYDNQITILPEGKSHRFFGWVPWLYNNIFSIAGSSFASTGKEYDMDTNKNGETRGFVVTGEMEKVFPFDIYPMYLVKSIMYNDIGEMENQGIYEVAPEDFALAEVINTSKIDIQKVVREGLDLMVKEVG
ncbi:MAG: Na(+)-translocating NADH-quinone reductase subunit A [Flavobacteriales bacterium]|nr:Na(+)-translocating NADH-quinone reductase subunit A [Flavobacteriales bacterium]